MRPGTKHSGSDNDATGVAWCSCGWMIKSDYAGTRREAFYQHKKDVAAMDAQRKDVEVTRDVLGFCLAWTHDTEGGQREGEVVTLPMSGDVVYFKTKREAQKAASLFNAGKTKEAFNGAY